MKNPVTWLRPRARSALRFIRKAYSHLAPSTARAAAESLEEQVYDAVIRQGDSILDIGAHSGRVSMYLAQIAGPYGLIVALEPNRDVYKALCDNLRRLNRGAAPVLPVPMAASNSPGLVRLHIPLDNPEGGSIADEMAWSTAQQLPVATELICAATTLDRLMGAGGISKVDFIKIDVEGAELLVLEGALHLIDTHRPLMFLEVFAPWQRAFGHKPTAIFNLLRQMGYEFLFACPGGLVEFVPSELAPFPEEFKEGYNVLAFIRNNHAERIEAVSELRVGMSRIALRPMSPPPRPNLPY